MIYRFKKCVEYAYMCEVEADSLEDAVRQVEINEVDWEDDEGGEGYITGHSVEKYDEDEDFFEEVDCDWEPRH